MRLFDTNGADARYSQWQEPPAQHEEDGCYRCHQIHLSECQPDKDCEYCQERQQAIDIIYGKEGGA